MAGLIGYKIIRQQVEIGGKQSAQLTAHRGLCVMYSNINRGNAVATINGSPEPGIEEISNNTQTAITFGDTGSYLQITNPKSGVLNIYNNATGALILYVLSIPY